MSALGRHILVEFFGCDSEILNEVTLIEGHMVEAARAAEATVINSTFHHFSPYGVSGVVVIQESHLAIHTWPEYQYAAVDVFTCGSQVNPWIAYDYLKKAFKAAHGSAMEMNRGQLDLLQRIDFELKGEQTNGHQEIAPPKYSRNLWFTDKNDDIALSLRHTGEVLYNKQTPFQRVKVLNTAAYGKMLAIDNMVMCTEKDEFVYHEMLTHVATLTHKNVKNALVIGGGDGGTVRELLRHPGMEKVKMVEIDEAVIEASKLHLPTLSEAFKNPKLDLMIGDGIEYIKGAAAASFDLIIVDGSDPVGPAEGLFSEEFYNDVYKSLKPDGVLVVQSESPRFHAEAFVDMFKVFRNVFGTEKVHCYLAFIPTYPTGMWSFAFCSKGNVHPVNDFDREAAAKFAKENNLQYYNEDIHTAAFALPTFVKDMMNAHVEVG